MNFKLRIWRQSASGSEGRLVDYNVENISEGASFPKMLDTLNEQLIEKGEDPIVFDHDCREGICGMCSLTINRLPHGLERATTVCQLHMLSFAMETPLLLNPGGQHLFLLLKTL